MRTASAAVWSITEEIQNVGDKPLRDVIDSLGGWPVLDSHWKGDNWTLEIMIGRLRGTHNTPLLVETWVAADDKNSSVNVIQASDAGAITLKFNKYWMREMTSQTQHCLRLVYK